MTLNYCMGTDNFTPLIIHVDLVAATVFMTESYFILSGNLLKMLNQTQGTREAAKTMFSHPEIHMFSSCFHALPASEKKENANQTPKTWSLSSWISPRFVVWKNFPSFCFCRIATIVPSHGTLDMKLKRCGRKGPR